MAFKLLDGADASAKLRAARAILDESQEIFSERLRMSARLLADLESGKRTPNLRLAVQIEELTGISPTEWMHGQKAAVA